MPTPPRVLLLGIDAAEQSLLLEWSSQGLLPHFRSLLQKARWGRVTNPPGFYAGAVWPSFWTGRRAPRHKRYCHTQIVPGSYELARTSPEGVRGEAFWNPLSRAGHRVAVIDVPKTPVSRDLNGIHVIDWGTSDRPGPLASWPPGLANELVSAFGEDPIPNCNGSRRTIADYEQLRDRLTERTRRTGKLAASLLDREAWDLFMAVFSEPHCIGHQCWHLHDPRHPLHDAEVVAALGDPLRDVYAAVDAEVGALLSRAGPETYVFLLASHGMGPRYEANFSLARILQRLQGRRTSSVPDRAAALAKNAWDSLPRLLKSPLRAARKPVKERLDGTRRDSSGDRYFQVPNNNHFGAIRINVLGREPSGHVQPGAEYEAVCDELIADLSALVDSRTGQAACQAVQTRDLYPDDDVSELPDVLVEWSREAPHGTLYSEKTGEIRGAALTCRTGDHMNEGLFLAAGPGIRPGPLDAPVAIEDFAPTVASLLDADLLDCDGQDLVPRLRD